MTRRRSRRPPKQIRGRRCRAAAVAGPARNDRLCSKVSWAPRALAVIMPCLPHPLPSPTLGRATGPLASQVHRSANTPAVQAGHTCALQAGHTCAVQAGTQLCRPRRTHLFRARRTTVPSKADTPVPGKVDTPVAAKVGATVPAKVLAQRTHRPVVTRSPSPCKGRDGVGSAPQNRRLCRSRGGPWRGGPCKTAAKTNTISYCQALHHDPRQITNRQTALPDALMIPEGRKQGTRMVDGVASIADVAEPLLDGDRPG